MFQSSEGKGKKRKKAESDDQDDDGVNVVEERTTNKAKQVIATINHRPLNL